MTGGSGNDVLHGNGGDDILYGGAGDDVLRGNTGLDRLFGDPGADRFVFATLAEAGLGDSSDIIEDFEAGTDRIDLSGIDAYAGMAGDQAFTYIGADPFSSTASELRYADNRLSGDVDGDGIADFDIRIPNLASLSDSDILL
jgi:serralysin